MDLPIFTKWPVIAKLELQGGVSHGQLEIRQLIITATHAEQLAEEVSSAEHHAGHIGMEVVEVTFFEFSTSLEKRTTWEKPT